MSVFILETHKQTNKECLPKFVQTDNASSSMKTGVVSENSLRGRIGSTAFYPFLEIGRSFLTNSDRNSREFSNIPLRSEATRNFEELRRQVSSRRRVKLQALRL